MSRLKEYNILLRQNINSLREATESSGNNNFIIADDLTRKYRTILKFIFRLVQFYLYSR